MKLFVLTDYKRDNTLGKKSFTDEIIIDFNKDNDKDNYYKIISEEFRNKLNHNKINESEKHYNNYHRDSKLTYEALGQPGYKKDFNADLINLENSNLFANNLNNQRIRAQTNYIINKNENKIIMRSPAY